MKFCVIGLGRFGYEVATTLANNRMEVLGIEAQESIATSIRDQITQAVCMRVTDEASLRSIGVDEMDTVIVAMGENFAESILITALLKQRLHIPLVITRAVSEIHKEILLLIGADRVVLPEQEIGAKLANNLSLPFFVIARITKNFSVTQLTAPHKFVGRTMDDIGLMKNYDVFCLGIKREEDVVKPKPSYVVDEHDILILAGSNLDLAEISKL